jgi:hypothetical protein
LPAAPAEQDLEDVLGGAAAGGSAGKQGGEGDRSDGAGVDERGDAGGEGAVVEQSGKVRHRGLLTVVALVSSVVLVRPVSGDMPTGYGADMRTLRRVRNAPGRIRAGSDGVAAVLPS